MRASMPGIRKRAESFRHAARGIRIMLRSQPNARIHAAALLVVVCSGLLLGLSGTEWALIVLAAALVICSEAMNTALEILADRVSPGWHPLVRDAKDAAAAAVLVSSLGAAVVGALVFIPAIIRR